MKDVTSTSFGLLIAFLLPGLAGLFSLSFWYTALQRVFLSFSTANSTVGLSIMVLLAALTVGMLISATRWAIFECWVCKKDKLEDEDFRRLDSESKLFRFRMIVDELYRYHQFWGGMAVVIPILSSGLMHQFWLELTKGQVFASIVETAVLELVTFVAARKAFQNYVRRAKLILKGAT